MRGPSSEIIKAVLRDKLAKGLTRRFKLEQAGHSRTELIFCGFSLSLAFGRSASASTCRGC